MSDIKLKFNLPYPCVKRNDLGKLTCGLLHPKTIRNLDSLGQGINGRFYIGPHIVAYPTEEVERFINKRLNELNPGNEIKEVSHD